MAGPERARAWRAYYTEKRIGHQWMQLDLLGGLPATRVLEVGPHLGLVTAMLANAGYDVVTLDRGPRRFERPAGPHLEIDLTRLDPAAIRGFDAILCCETLEHLAWADVPGVLRAFRAAGAPHLIVSVPYEGLQFHLSLYVNPWRFRQRVAFRKGRSLRRFEAGPPGAHQWEVGWRGMPLRTWERALQAAGWRIARRTFSAGCRSVFHVLEAR